VRLGIREKKKHPPRKNQIVGRLLKGRVDEGQIDELLLELRAHHEAALELFSDEPNAQAMLRAIEQVEAQLGNEYPLVIGGERVTTGDLEDSVNPSQFSQVVGRVHLATRDLADQAINAAWSAFEKWKNIPAEQRAAYLFKASAEMRRRKYEFNAWLVFEVGK